MSVRLSRFQAEMSRRLASNDPAEPTPSGWRRRLRSRELTAPTKGLPFPTTQRAPPNLGANTP